MTLVVTEMTQSVMYAFEQDDLTAVWASMQALGVRHIPVVRDDKLVGILSDRDFLRLGICAKDGTMDLPLTTVGKVMKTDVMTCEVSESVGRVAEIMIEHKIDALPVITPEGNLLGIITSTDLLDLLRGKDEEVFRGLASKWETRPILAEQTWRPSPR